MNDCGSVSVSISAPPAYNFNTVALNFRAAGCVMEYMCLGAELTAIV